MNSTDFYLEQLLDKEPVKLERVDLTELVAVIAALGPSPSAEDIATAIAKVLHIPQPIDPTPQLEQLAKELKHLVERIGGMRFGGGGPSEIRVKNKTNDPVPVTLANQPDLTGTWAYEAATLTSGSLSATGNCVALRVYTHESHGTFNINGGDEIIVRADTGFDLGPEAQLVDPVINHLTGTLDCFLAVLS